MVARMGTTRSLHGYVRHWAAMHWMRRAVLGGSGTWPLWMMSDGVDRRDGTTGQNSTTPTAMLASSLGRGFLAILN
uniref:Uncharacterized protein n=1 Tax=Kalanchoe fedtschenkoi TaxID=63787 RepID=A0A7N0SZ54_KALFE